MPLVTEEIDYLCTLVAERSGNQVSSGQSYLLEARLGPVAEDAGLENISALVAELQRSANRRLHDQVAEAMTINETSFFRDIQPFDAMRDELLPELIERRAHTRQLWIWSAASSSGQEPYSIAMTIREHFPQLADWKICIIATDLSDEMLKRTQDGCYSQFEVNRGLPARMMVKYFDRHGTRWQAKEELRRMMDVRKLNLTAPWPALPTFDIVFLRNVLIYFDLAAKTSILERVHQLMRPDASLFLGGGETTITLRVPLTRHSVGQTVCYRPVANQGSHP